MRILLTGASGFIGSHVLSALLGAGHEVRAAIRKPVGLQRRFPAAEVVHCDFNHDTQMDAWLPRLAGIDAVINCAGVLRGGSGQNIDAIHVAAPKALFAACRSAGVRRVIHVSAVSADDVAGTEYARTKKRAEDALRASDLDWVVLRPSLVYASGSYGGTSLLRGLAAIPWCIPVVGAGAQPFRPIHVHDLAAGIIAMLDRPAVARETLEPAGPEVVSLSRFLELQRGWLGIRSVPLLHVPLILARFGAWVGGLLGVTALNATALRQLQYGNTGDPASWERATGVRAGSLETWLQREPSHVQDRWHARLFFVRPLLRLTLATVWLLSGALALTAGRDEALALLATAAVSGAALPLLFYGSCLFDIAVGVVLLARPSLRALGVVQLVVIAAYTAFLTVAIPDLWLDPLGPVLKNVAVMALVLAWMAVEDER